MMHWIDEARQNGSRLASACAQLDISSKTYQRWSQADSLCDGRLHAQHSPTNKLSEFERKRVIQIANASEYANLPPNKIVPKLADKGVYIASESTFYRILKEENLLAHRQKTRPPRTVNKPKALVATAPNTVYSWDITYLPSAIKGIFFYLYLVIDIFSRKIVGWQVHDREASELAAELMTDICQRENISPNQVTLHSDNGSPMKGATLLATLHTLGVIPSRSRPAVSNDNPYSESLFRTLKYCPDYPEDPFMDLNMARHWVQGFVQWYNEEHLHSGIKYVTPSQRHQGQDKDILAQRKKVYQQAKENYPRRWSRHVRNWDYIDVVSLNPDSNSKKMEQHQAA